MTDPRQATRDLAARYAAAGDPNGWFEEFYALAGGDIRRVYWADLAPLVAPEGVVLVSCRSREAGQEEDGFPVPLDRREIGRFVTEAGLVEQSFLAHDDTQDPPVPHFFAVYRRESVTAAGARQDPVAVSARRRIA